MMLKLLLISFFLPLSCISNAATVHPVELTESTIQFLNKKPANSTQVPAVNNQNTTTVQTSRQDEDFIGQQPETGLSNQEIYFFNSPTIQSPQQQDNSNQQQPELAEFIQKLSSEYENDEFIQQSLSMLNEVKQLWNNADTQANAFIADIISSSELEKLIERDLAKIQASLQDSNKNIFLKDNKAFSNLNFYEGDLSYNELLRSQEKNDTMAQELNKMTKRLLNKLFSITTVYYLITLFIIISLTRWAIKFILRLIP